MSTADGGGPRDGAHHPEDPGLFEPGLDPLIRALTASGHPHEQAGRDAALTAFRAASKQQHRAGPATEARVPRPRPRRSGAHGYPGRPRRPLRLRLPARLAAVCTAGFTVLAGVTAAAYAQVLPAPVQQVAHSVLAPLGVPDGKPVSGVPVALPSGASSSGASSSGASSSGGTASPGGTASSAAPARPSSTGSVSVATSRRAAGRASSTSAPGAGQYVVTLSAARARVPSGVPDLFTATVSHLGHPASGIHVRLLERVAGSSAWQRVAAGVTGPRGRVALWSPGLTTSAAFRLAGPGAAPSAAVVVTLVPPIRLRLAAGQLRDRLIVVAPGGSPGEGVNLMRLVGGAWETVAGKPLGPELRAVFVLPVSSAAGYLYRAELSGTASSAAGTPVSNRVWIPRKPGTGAGIASPGPTATPSATAIPGPAPTPSASVTS